MELTKRDTSHHNPTSKTQDQSLLKLYHGRSSDLMRIIQFILSCLPQGLCKPISSCFCNTSVPVQDSRTGARLQEWTWQAKNIRSSDETKRTCFPSSVLYTHSVAAFSHRIVFNSPVKGHQTLWVSIQHHCSVSLLAPTESSANQDDQWSCKNLKQRTQEQRQNWSHYIIEI